jgi:MurNAc alpha-1-phosphate uridylyltransferase
LLGSEPFLVVNGDIYTDFDFTNIALQPNSHAHLVLVDNPPQHLQGDFAIEAGALKRAGEPMLTFSGVGLYHPDLFKEVIKGEAAKLAPLLRKAIDNNLATAWYYQGVWHDIGTPERLKQLDEKLTCST